MDASDILEDLEILLPEAKPSPESAARPLPPLSDEERRVYESIMRPRPPIDEIAARSELPSAAVSSTLLQLELKRLVKQLPGKYFVKLG
jgi:Predicted Rossmann fold nucleotide-binding protein involved in DNA uptake